MKKMIYPGSFDPITNGHIDIIIRASKLTDILYVCIADNPSKNYYFDINERVRLVKEACKNIENVEVISTSGLVIKKAEELGCQCMCRGLRAVTDFEFEFQLFAGNEFINKGIETIFLMSSTGKGFISSSGVKEFVNNGVDVSSLVPECVNNAFKNK